MAVQGDTELLRRIRCTALHAKVTEAEHTIQLFRDGMYLGFSGFAGGNPTVLPTLLADHVEHNGLRGKMRFNVYTGASIDIEIDNRWAELDMIDKRWPHQQGHAIQKAINGAQIDFGDRFLSLFAQDFGYGFYTMANAGKIDIGIIEASCITKDGGIVPTLAVGIVSEIVAWAEKLIIEINTTIPSLEGIHDCVGVTLPPHRNVLEIRRVDDRIGSTSIECDPRKIVAIVESRVEPVGRHLGPFDEKSGQMADHILEFLTSEVECLPNGNDTATKSSCDRHRSATTPNRSDGSA